MRRRGRFERTDGRKEGTGAGGTVRKEGRFRAGQVRDGKLDREREE